MTDTLISTPTDELRTVALVTHEKNVMVFFYDAITTTFQHLFEYLAMNYSYSPLRNAGLHLAAQDAEPEQLYTPELGDALLSSLIQNHRVLDIKIVRPLPSIPAADQVIAAPGKTITLFIKTMTGKTIVINIDPDADVPELKRLICVHEGIPEDQQRLIYAGFNLDDEHKIKVYGITKNATIHLVLRLRGGMYTETSGRNGRYQRLEPLTLHYLNIDSATMAELQMANQSLLSQDNE